MHKFSSNTNNGRCVIGHTNGTWFYGSLGLTANLSRYTDDQFDPEKVMKGFKDMSEALEGLKDKAIKHGRVPFVIIDSTNGYLSVTVKSHFTTTDRKIEEKYGTCFFLNREELDYFEKHGELTEELMHKGDTRDPKYGVNCFHNKLKLSTKE